LFHGEKKKKIEQEFIWACIHIKSNPQRGVLRLCEALLNLSERKQLEVLPQFFTAMNSCSVRDRIDWQEVKGSIDEFQRLCNSIPDDSWHSWLSHQERTSCLQDYMLGVTKAFYTLPNQQSKYILLKEVLNNLVSRANNLKMEPFGFSKAYELLSGMPQLK
jgi:hypothetical protein